MPAKFRLEIDLGNDEMQSPQHVAEALERVGRELYRGALWSRTPHRFRDGNGNTVGRYWIEPELSEIASLNDRFRRSFRGGKVIATQGIAALPALTQLDVMLAVQDFNQWSDDNDPHLEHDFVSVDVESVPEKVFAKIDYYNSDMSAGSENPADPKQTTRVMTIMLASEY